MRRQHHWAEEAEKILKWYFTLQEFEFTSELRSVGTTFYYVEEIPVGTMKLNFQVTEWVENERIVFRMTSGEFLKDDEQSWTLEKTANGCKFIFLEDGEFPFGIFGKLLGLFARIGSRANVKKMLVMLKGLVEGNN